MKLQTPRELHHRIIQEADINEERNIGTVREIARERCMSPVEWQKIVDDLRLI